MRNFIILFDEKEGTSPLMRLLDNFDQISIIRQAGGEGTREPFEKHSCGPMSIRNLKQCLDIIFNNKPIDIKKLNSIYTRTAKKPLEKISNEGVVGFKMRFSNKGNRLYVWPLKRLFKKYHSWSFKNMMINLFKKNNVTALFAVRQDVLRWGLSKYHGDGTGSPGHLQFKLAKGELSKEEIGKFHVDCKQLEKIILRCEKRHAKKRHLMEDFKSAGIQAHPICYEDFLSDKHKYFKRLFEFLELEVSKEEIDNALNRGEYFKKVHSDDISEIVVNHEEVKEKFGNRFISWK